MPPIYTRTGDAGETGVLGPERVRKDNPRVEACGALDELNAAIGWARALNPNGELAPLLAQVQGDLLHLGAELARPKLAKPRIGPAHVERLERAIDELDARLPPLRSFVLPGGSQEAAALHVARAVCRRAERRVVTLSAGATVGAEALKYLNRLSDLLFVAARAANHAAGVADEAWTPSNKPAG